VTFLDFVRGCVLKKTDGLDDEQLRRQLVPSGTTLLGLVRHLTDGERYWFGYHLVGTDLDEPDFEMEVADLETDTVLADYREAIGTSNENIRSVGDPAARLARPVDGEPLSLRWVLAHMTGETTRHAGHADILRELIDGVTGR
jgi:uncharacterized damage-inducible protein DinB